MTTQTSYSDRKISGNNRKYFLLELRYSWPKMVLYFIIFCLTMVIPLLMQDMGVPHRFEETSEEYVLKCSSILLRLITEYVQIWAPMSMIVAVFAGCYVTKIMQNKVSADFYHSTPLRRESIFITRLATGFITYFATFIINVIIVLILCETQTLADGFGLLIFKQILINVGYSLLAFFIIYSTTVFAGMLCGTIIMQLLMTLYLNLVVFVYYSSFFTTLELFTEKFDASYYLSDTILQRLVPFVRLMDLGLIKELTAADISFFVIGSLLLFVGSMALYKFRKIEKAGTPIVFEGFESFFRYSVIIPVTLLGGIFFDLLVGSFVWYIIGLIISAFLCFLLINTILSKNARKMFQGIKGFAIYAAVMLLFFVIIGFDIFGIDNYIPEANSIKSVHVTIGNQINYDFDDREVIKSAIELDKSHKDVFSYYEKEDYVSFDIRYKIQAEKYEIGEYSEHFYTSDYDRRIYYVVYKLKSGIDIARRVSVPVNSDQMKAFTKAIANSDDYEELYLERLEKIEANNYYATYDFISDANYDQDRYISEDDITSIADNFNGIDYNYYQRPQIGEIRIYGFNTGSIQIPVYCDDKIAPIFMMNMSVDEYYDSLANEIDGIVIYKGNKPEFSVEDGIILPNNKTLYKTVLKNLCDISDSNNIFTESESEYHVGIVYKNSTRNMCTKFLKGRVPEEIMSLFPEN